MPSYIDTVYPKLLLEEDQFIVQGYKTIVGIDEAGRGPLAGPVVAACVNIPRKVLIENVNDSKKVSPLKRLKAFKELITHSKISFGVGIVSPQEIDQINILQASLLAMKLAYQNCQIKADLALIDGSINLKLGIDSKPMIKGDSRSYLIAAASIIAKETRDQIMLEYDKKWPEYGFAKHKGYGTKLHREAILEYGICDIHRKSFEPIKSMIQSQKLVLN